MQIEFGVLDRKSRCDGGPTYQDFENRKQLGLPIGTATNRLKKLILFTLIQETGRDSCLRCKAKISSVNDFAVDHYTPWRNASPELFWDLRNIGFSHKRCNSLARRTTAGYKLGPNPGRKVGKPGEAWCCQHKAFASIDAFAKNRSRWNGLNSSCKACSNKSDQRARRSALPTSGGGVEKKNRRPPNPRRIGGEGTAWCSGHQLFLPIAGFNANKRRWTGVQTQCKECNLAYLHRRRGKV
ncbi:MAG: hypothetical protein JO359_04250 [Candidatus Eremiobacteraeota bacterium]|nr:hypothetical protein [Candidatus Eremiobacteraeota bacterium]